MSDAHTKRIQLSAVATSCRKVGRRYRSWKTVVTFVPSQLRLWHCARERESARSNFIIFSHYGGDTWKRKSIFWGFFCYPALISARIIRFIHLLRFSAKNMTLRATTLIKSLQVFINPRTKKGEVSVLSIYRITRVAVRENKIINLFRCDTAKKNLTRSLASNVTITYVCAAVWLTRPLASTF